MLALAGDLWYNILAKAVLKGVGRVLLAVNIENSRIDVGCFAQAGLLHRFSVGADPARTADEYALLLGQMLERKGLSAGAAAGVMLGSVVPRLTPVLEVAVRSLTSAPLLTVGPGVRTGFAIRVDDPAELGADLAADVAGAIALCGAPVLVLHFGSVTAISVVDARGAYVGGAFLPGLRQSADAMQTAELLPDIGMTERVPLIGKNSADCMRAGLLRGAGFAVMGLVEAYRRELGGAGKLPLVATGEFAPAMLPYLDKTVRYERDLTLLGLAEIFDLNYRKR